MLAHLKMLSQTRNDGECQCQCIKSISMSKPRSMSMLRAISMMLNKIAAIKVVSIILYLPPAIVYQHLFLSENEEKKTLTKRRHFFQKNFISVSKILISHWYWYKCNETTGCPKKGTNRMLLEPWRTGSITSGRHPLGLENVFLVVSY